MIRFALSLLFASARAAYASPCATIDLPALTPDFVAVSRDRLNSPGIDKVCAEVMPWCNRIWLSNKRSGVSIVEGAQLLDEPQVRRSTLPQFLREVAGMEQKLKAKYEGQNAVFGSRSEIVGNAIVVNRVDVNYVRSGNELTDIFLYFFFDPSCRLDFLINGPRPQVAEAWRDLAPSFERFKTALPQRFPDGLSLSPKRLFRLDEMGTLAAIWLAGLGAGMVLVWVLVRKGWMWRLTALRLWLAVVALFFLGVNGVMVAKAIECQRGGAAVCQAGAPENLSFAVFGALVVLGLLYGIFARSGSRSPLLLAGVIGQQLLLLVYTARFSGVSLGMGSNALVAFVSLAVLFGFGRRRVEPPQSPGGAIAAARR